MKTNEVLQKDVQNAIKWEPTLNAAEIGVTVTDGIVTLTGTVDNYAKKSEAEAAAKNVAGVKVVVENIVVRFHDDWAKKDDGEIAAAIIHAFKWNWKVQADTIKVKVENGWVTLAGTAYWNYQRDAAYEAVKKLVGVTGVQNNITIKTEFDNDIEKKDIEEALKRNWSIDDQAINVGVFNHAVTLKGNVDSYYQKEEVARIAWNAPGVLEVDNQLVVEYNLSF